MCPFSGVLIREAHKSCVCVYVTLPHSTAKSEVLPVIQKLLKDDDADVRFFSDKACVQITTFLSG